MREHVWHPIYRSCIRCGCTKEMIDYATRPCPEDPRYAGIERRLGRALTDDEKRAMPETYEKDIPE